MFKVGDKVRRLGEYIGYGYSWPCGTDPVLVTDIMDNTLTVAGVVGTWDLQCFEPAGPEYSTITQHKVGPYLVTVVMTARKQDLQDAFFTGGNLVANWGLGGVLQECEEDYRDPEMGHEDMLERLRDRLVKIEGVTQIDIVGVNDGCGVRISLEG